jgi:iron complex outermembrane receptor protein
MSKTPIKASHSTKLLATAIAATSLLMADLSAQARELEEVVISARRVDETLQSVPLAVTAITADKLEQSGVQQLFDLQNTTPALVMTPSQGRNGMSSIGIRGQKSSGSQLAQDPSVAVYIADVVQMRHYGFGAMSGLDIASIEVLKGPQGTLFGRNTTGGAILVRPNLPSTGGIEASLGLGVGDYARQKVEGMLNLPLTDDMAVRIAAAANRHDGYIENVAPGGRDYNDEDSIGWRAAFSWDITDDFRTIFHADKYRSDDSGSAGRSIYVGPSSSLRSFYPGLVDPALAQNDQLDFWQVNAIPHTPDTRGRRKGFSQLDVWGISNTTELDLNNTLSLKSILGYRRVETNDLGDSDGTMLPLINSNQFVDIEQYSAELQLVGSTDSFDWIAGLYWFEEEGEDGSISASFARPVDPVTLLRPASAPNAFPTYSGGFATNTSYSVFGQGTYQFDDQWSFTLGYRLSRDERELDARSRNLGARTCGITGFGLTFANCSKKADVSFTEPSWNVSLNYQLSPDALIYLAHRHGYRAGGFGMRASTPIEFERPFEPEFVDDLELGLKLDTDLAGSPLRINTALFYSDISDMQRNASFINPTTGVLGNLVQNAAAASITGGELEWTWLLTDNLEFSGFYNYMNASYDKWEDVIGGRATDVSNRDFMGVPENKVNVSLRYRLPLDVSIGDIYVQASAVWQDETALHDNPDHPSMYQDEYTLVNARIDWEGIMGAENISASLWANNLTEEEYYTGGLWTGSVAYGQVYMGNPRTIGADLKIRF